MLPAHLDHIPLAEPILIQHTRTIPLDKNIGPEHELTQRSPVGLGTQVQERVPLAVVQIRMQGRPIAKVGRRDTHHASAQLGHAPGDGWAGDDTGQIDDLEPSQGPMRGLFNVRHRGPPVNSLFKIEVYLDLKQAVFGVCLPVLGAFILLTCPTDRSYLAVGVCHALELLGSIPEDNLLDWGNHFIHGLKGHIVG